MSDKTNGVEAQGVDSQKVEVPSLEVIEKWVTRDLGICVSFLNALHSDTALQKQMAVWIQGRYSNSLNKVDPAQVKMPL